MEAPVAASPWPALGGAAWARVAATVLIGLALPALLISSGVRWLSEDRNLYLEGFSTYRVADTTRLDTTGLEQIADAFIAYFRAPPGRMAVEVEREGRREPLFNERELTHMEDVQALVLTFHRLQLASAALLALLAVAGAIVLREHAWTFLGQGLVLGAVLTVGLGLVVGALALLDFQSLFLRFHLTAFTNDLWILDPRRDALIMLFPRGFWLDATLRLAGLVAAGAAAAGVVGGLLWAVGSRQ